MTTPAQEAGFIVNVTRLKVSNPEHARYNDGEVWLLSTDDRSGLPFFRSEVGNKTECFFIEDMEIIPEVPVSPKFPTGSRVVVVNSGWGFGPERIGQVMTVVDFTLRGSEPTTYKVADERGERAGGDIWEASFELAPPLVPSLAHLIQTLPVVPPAPVPLSLEKPPLAATANIPVYTDLQQKAINTFQTMYDEAVKLRNGERSRLNGDYGICDNIDRFARECGTSESPMSEVKENLIRVTAIYSGNYTYPVPCPDGGDASNAFSRHSKKWDGPYGANRLEQLKQLIELIKTNWTDDSMTRRKTPAFRNGLSVGDLVMYTRRDVPSFWIFRRDDESMSPSFHKLNDENEYTDIDLNYIRKVDSATLKERTVSEFLEELKTKAEEKADIARQIAELQAKLTQNQTDIAMLDFALAQQHKVKRIS